MTASIRRRLDHRTVCPRSLRDIANHSLLVVKLSGVNRRRTISTVDFARRERKSADCDFCRNERSYPAKMLCAEKTEPLKSCSQRRTELRLHQVYPVTRRVIGHSRQRHEVEWLQYMPPGVRELYTVSQENKTPNSCP